MAQLTDDCFAVGGALMPIEAALVLIAERVPIVAGTETVPLAWADGRIAAEDVRAAIDLPPFDNSAVDGYAVRHADLAAGRDTRLPVGGRAAAGHAADAAPGTASAVRIFTGAPMPAGFDTVFMQEDVRRDGDEVVLPDGLRPGSNRRFAGEDVACGEIAVAAGRRLGPADLALAAALGRGSLSVRRRLRVAVFSTGDELAEPDGPLRPGAIHDSNRVMLAALLRRLGAEVHDLGILRDDRSALASRIAAVAGCHNLVVTSGGVSTGEEDHVRAALESVGRLVFWRLGIKPGRPVAMGLVGGVPLVGLPGNPVAAYVTLLFVVRPLLARLAGAHPAPPLGVPVRAAFAYGKKAGRREFVRCTLRREADGALAAVKFPREGAALLSSLTGSDGLAEIADGTTRVVEGDMLTFYPHAALWQ